MYNIESKHKNIIFLFIVLSCFYFNVLPYFIRLIGLNVKSGYYNLINIDGVSLLIVSLLNFILFIFTCLLFFFEFKKKYKLNVEKYDLFFILYISLVLLSVYISLDFLSLNRNEIKESSNIYRELLVTTTLSILSYRIIISTFKLELFLNAVLVLYFSFVLFEREVLIYAFFPFLMRAGFTIKNSKKFIILMFLLVASFLIYKQLLNFLKTDATVLILNHKQENIAEVLGKDTIHKLSLELSYLNDDAPVYNKFSMFSPYQFFRLLDDEYTTNGRIATDFYTGNKTGTGFSSSLEGFLNFSFLYVLILPLIYTYIYRFVIVYGGCFLLTPFIVFMVKINRADFWPLLLSVIIFPFIIYKFLIIVSYLKKLYK